MEDSEISKVLKKIEGFDWNKGNIDKNWEKHRVNNKETEEVFLNKPLLISPDKKHSTEREKRFHSLGKTNQGRKLFIAFTIRGNKIRIISVRDQNKKERRNYEK